MPRASEVYPHRGLASKPYRMYTNRPLELVLPSSAIMFTHPPCKHMQTGRVADERLTFQTANCTTQPRVPKPAVFFTNTQANDVQQQHARWLRMYGFVVACYSHIQVPPSKRRLSSCWPYGRLSMYESIAAEANRDRPLTTVARVFTKSVCIRHSWGTNQPDGACGPWYA